MLLKGIALAAIAATAMMAADQESVDHRLHRAAETFNEIMSTPDKGIPSDLLGRAQCVVIIPGLKKGASLSAASTARDSRNAVAERAGRDRRQLR